MKKHVVLRNIGTWELQGNTRVTHCTVERMEVAFESNDYAETMEAYKEFGYNTTYAPNGEWYSYSYEPRKSARSLVEYYKNRG